MKDKRIKSSEILEVNEDSIVVKIEFDVKLMVADFLYYGDNVTDMIKDLAERMGKVEKRGLEGKDGRKGWKKWKEES